MTDLNKHIEQYTAAGLHFYPVRSNKRPYEGAKWSSRRWAETKKTHVGWSQVPGLGVGFRPGLQENGRYIIVLDCDIVGTNRDVCPQTTDHWDQIQRWTHGKGCFNSSSCGNFSCLVDVTDVGTPLKHKLSNGKNSIAPVDGSQLEILNRMNCVLPPSITKCKVHQALCNKRRFLTDTLVFNCSPDMEAWLLQIIPEPASKPERPAHSQRTTPTPLTVPIYEDGPKPTRKQLTIVQDILADLPKVYSNQRPLWRNVGWALRDYANCHEVFKLFQAWSQRSPKYQDGDCESIWNSFSGGQPIRFPTLVFYHQKTGIKRPYSKLFIDKPIDLMEGVEQLPINIKNFESQFMTSEQGEINIFEADREQLSGKMICVKSHTGSGKTTALKRLRELYTDDSHLVISVGSRVVLVHFHSQAFGLRFYQDLKGGEWNEMDQSIAIQMDSLHRLSVPLLQDRKIVLYLDEVNSLVRRLTTQQENMSRNRAPILKVFSDLLHRAEATFCVDADLSTSAIKFLANPCINPKPITLHWNRIQLTNKAPVNVFPDPEVFLRRLVETIEQEQPVYVCSNSYKLFERDIVEPIRRRFHPKQEVFFFSSEDGARDLLRTPEKLRGAIICVTPTVLYGLDFNWKASVFGYYTPQETIGALNAVQQLARIRKPVAINLYLAQKEWYPEFQSVADYRTYWENATKRKLMKSLEMGSLAHITGAQLDAYKTLVYEMGYLDHRYLGGFRFHVLDILQSKGFKIHHHHDLGFSNAIGIISRLENKLLCPETSIQDRAAMAQQVERLEKLVRTPIIGSVRSLSQSEYRAKRRQEVTKILVAENKVVQWINGNTGDEPHKPEPLKLDPQKIKAVAAAMDSFQAQTGIETSDILKSNEIIGIIADPRRLGCFRTLGTWIGFDQEALIAIMKNKKELGAMGHVRSTTNRVLQLKKLCKTMRVNPDQLLKMDLKQGLRDVLQGQRLQFEETLGDLTTVPKELIAAFDLRGKKYKTGLDRVGMWKLLVDLTYQLFSPLMKPVKFKIQGKDYYTKAFHEKKVQLWVKSFPILKNMEEYAFED